MRNRVGHVIRRARERYGLELREKDILVLARAIADRLPTARLVSRHQDGFERWRVDFGNHRGFAALRVVWDPMAYQVLTVLPPSAKASGKWNIGQIVGRER